MLYFVIHSKLPFPSDPHPLSLHQVCEPQLPCHVGCTNSPSSILPGKYEHSFYYQPGRPTIKCNNFSHWLSHEAFNPFQEGWDVSDFSISQLRSLFESPYPSLGLIKSVLSIHTCQVLNFSSSWNKKDGKGCLHGNTSETKEELKTDVEKVHLKTGLYRVWECCGYWRYLDGKLGLDYGEPLILSENDEM